MRHPLSVIVRRNLVVPFHVLPTRQWFLDALDNLSQLYRFIDLAELERIVEGRTPLARCCHVTFDDGDRTFYDIALPALIERQVPATLFVSPAIVKTRENYWFQRLSFLRTHLGDQPIKDVIASLFDCPVAPLEPHPLVSLFLSMTRDDMERVLEAAGRDVRDATQEPQNIDSTQLREAVATGLVTVGAHTMTHPVLANESDERSSREIEDSVAELSESVGRPVISFAYPNGTSLDFGAREQRFLRRAGIRLAFAMTPDFAAAGSDPLAIPRGACPSVDGEPRALSLARAAWLPWWERLRQAAGKRKSEAAERQQIQALEFSAVRRRGATA